MQTHNLLYNSEKTKLMKLKEDIHMITALVLIILTIGFAGKLLGFAFKCAWGISKIALSVILLPLAIIGFIIGGLFHIAIPLLAIYGIISLCKKA